MQNNSTPQNWDKYWKNANDNFKSIVEPKLNLESVYGNYNFEKLDKGNTNWKACCPFHKDESPSLIIYSNSLQYHCFGCGEHGSPEKFITKTKNISRKEAMVELSRTVGVEESHVFGKHENYANKIRSTSSSVEEQLKKIKNQEIQNKLEEENKRWNLISSETAGLFHKINLLENATKKVLEMEKIKLLELEKIREINSLIKTKINENNLEIEKNSSNISRNYRFILADNKSLKCKYDIGFKENDINYIKESTWLEEKKQDGTISKILDEQHKIYKKIEDKWEIRNLDLPNSNKNLENSELVLNQRTISSSNPNEEMFLKIKDFKDISNKIKDNNNNINKVMANELYYVIDNMLKIPQKDVNSIIESLDKGDDLKNILIKLPNNKEIKISNKVEVIDKNKTEIEKSITIINNSSEEKIINIDNIKNNNFYKDRTDEHNKVISTLNEINIKFQENLYSETQEAKKALTYLYDRGLSDSDIKKFELGLTSPGIIDKGIEEGLSIDQLKSAGLLNEKNKEQFIGNRITFPIHAADSALCGFSARNIHENKDYIKYVNSPSTDIFSKGEILYGLDSAKNSIIKENNAIVVEGFLDVIQMRKNGINNSVAVMGTSLTENHVNQLKCLTENVTLCFDNDNAGKIAFKRSLDIAGPHLNVAQLNIVNAKDPDEFLKKYGKDEFIKVLENSKNISKPENYEQQFDKNSTKISHRLSNPNLEMEMDL